jgi:uncharacterized damage-inducible protein DinB
MAQGEQWQSIVASALDWEQAHATLDSALDQLQPALRGRRPGGLPHSVWELVDHIRRTQRDLLEFCTNPKYREPHFPDDLWPSSQAPADDAEWEQCIAGIHADASALATFTTSSAVDLTARIPHGTGQTYLRTVLVAVDHTSYHVGQIILTRRLLGAWPAE